MTNPSCVSSAASVAVIDDDPSVRRSLTNLFDSLGFPVTSFASAEDFLTGNVSTTGCVVLDHRLPGMSGLELLERLVNVPNRMGVVMITAHADQQIRRRAVELGADAFYTKPFRSEDLVKSVQRRLTPET